MNYISDYDNYFALDDGNIYSGFIARNLKPWLRKGYLYVSLRRNGKAKTIAVHALIALTYLGPRPTGMQINHKDGNKLNNSINNLEYVSPKYNTQHAIALGLRDSLKGNKHHAKLNLQDVKFIRDNMSHLTLKDIANKYNVSVSAISNLRNNRTHSLK